jgi:hypothetical protein
MEKRINKQRDKGITENIRQTERTMESFSERWRGKGGGGNRLYRSIA